MILDTNALSALADGDPLIEKPLQLASEIALPIIVLGEYRYGIRQSRHCEEYERWLHELIPACRILDVDQATSGQYADVRLDLRRLGQPIPGNDIWIAALARQHKLPILSRDAHFDIVPRVQRLSW